MLKILLIEDDPFLREAMREVLNYENYQVVEAHNGRAAQDMILSEKIDLVISDVRMPQMGGVEFLSWLKREKPTPCILMTAYSDSLETRAIFNMEIDNFLMKPFFNADLLSAVQEVRAKLQGAVFNT